ncbi:UDP-N-acetyl-D-galactosamine dehydrogenase [Bacteroidia bacterium]|nr:UDP-N-acetyl-D-galactosamine dehydrogenase [Bacteroidia bacterium]
MQKIAIIGLGYVGLPLARLFATKYLVVGFDVNKQRIAELQAGHDRTLEVSDELLQAVLTPKSPERVSDPCSAKAPLRGAGGAGLEITDNSSTIRDCNIYIVTVPTPVDEHKHPDLSALRKASETVGKVISKGDIVIYESTVYPGATEEDCIPIIESVSGLKFNQDFFAGYSPERINPGDKEHTVEKIKKITSGSTPEIAKKIDELYNSVLQNGTHLAPSIKVAEAAKVIENAQRDINIAFVNELKKILDKMDVDINAVLDAAGTKWNFLKFRPGLVGGHCTGVDPYYLAQKAQEYGYHPEIILAGRRMNDSMGEYMATQVVKKMIKQGIPVKDSQILVMGITFKENCPDIRNTKVVDVVRTLQEYDAQVTVYDPLANVEEVKREYDIEITNQLPSNQFDAVAVAVLHQQFGNLDYSKLLKDNSVVYNFKG